MNMLQKSIGVVFFLSFLAALVMGCSSSTGTGTDLGTDPGTTPNSTPAALDDTIASNEDIPITLNTILDNDSDQDGDPLNVIDFDAVSREGGTVNQNADGTLVYTPPTNFNGNDQFSYVISDGRNATARANIRLSIIAVNDPPLAINDVASVIQDKIATSRSVTDNDSDPDGDALSIDVSQSELTSHNGATITYRVGGGFEYTAPLGFIGHDQFTYTVTDNKGGSDTATVNVFVSGDRLRVQPDVVTNNMRFGQAVDANDNFAVVGSPTEKNGQGAAYVFVRDQLNEWRQIARLTAGPDAQDFAEFGWAVAIHGDMIVVGAHFEDISTCTDLAGNTATPCNSAGAVYFFQLTEQGQWVRSKRLTAGAHARNFSNFGRSLAINKRFILVGAPAHTLSDPGAVEETGAAFVFDINNGDPILSSAFIPSDYDAFETEFARFGQSVELSDDNLAIVGAEFWDSGVGAVYVYEQDARTGIWSSATQLLSNTPGDDQFGASVAIQDNQLFVGAPFGLRIDLNTCPVEFNVCAYGKAEVYNRASNGGWVFQQTLRAFNLDSNLFGMDVSVSGDLLMIGSLASNNLVGPAGYLYIRDSVGMWQEQDVFRDDDQKDFQTAAVNLTGRTAIIGAPSDDTGATNAGSAFIYNIAQNLQADTTTLRDQNKFLKLITSVFENNTTASAYYQAIDQNNTRTTLDDWKITTGFGTGQAPLTDAQAVYVNGADLGFGRRMLIRRNTDGSVASYVENYPTLQDAIDRTNIIATVAMEYTSPANNLTGEKFTTFYVFAPDGTRLNAVDLDGRGEKMVPGVCNVCHGGAPLPLNDDGSYKGTGDTHASFLPWDIDTFIFSNTDPNYSRSLQEDQFKILNQSVLETNPTPAAVELIHGWYGGDTLPNDVFDGQFVPDGWLPVSEGGPVGNPDSSKDLYLQVLGPYCRACHIQRGRQSISVLDFNTYSEFVNYKTRIKQLVYDDGTMPLALKTFANFWSSDAPAIMLAPHINAEEDYVINLPGTTLVKKPGRPIAKAGGHSTVQKLDTESTVHVRLSGAASAFAVEYQWTFVGKPAGSQAVIIGGNSKFASFFADVPGVYHVQLTVSDGIVEDTDIATVTMEESCSHCDGLYDFNAVVEIFNAECTRCHNASHSKLNLEGSPTAVVRALLLSKPNLVRLDAPEESLILQSPSNLISHDGGQVIKPYQEDYNTIKGWIIKEAGTTISP